MSLPVWQEGKKKKQTQQTNHNWKPQTGKDIIFQGRKQTEGQIVPQAVTMLLR